MPHRAHVPRRGPAARRAAHDPGQHARGGDRGPRGAAQGPEGRLHRDPRARWTACPSPSACSTRRCTSSCPTVDELEVKKQVTTGLTAEETDLYERGRAGPSSTRCSAPAACASAWSSPASTPCRCGRCMEAAAELRQGRARPDRRDHDPAHRHPRGAGRGPLAGSRRAIDGRHQGPEEEARRCSIGTMIETPRAAIRADEIAEEAELLQLRHQRPHPDDLRLQPRRRREPDDAGLPRGRAARSATRSRPSTPAASASSVRIGAERRPGKTKPEPQARRVRRARRRPRVDRPVPPGRPRLRRAARRSGCRSPASRRPRPSLAPVQRQPT